MYNKENYCVYLSTFLYIEKNYYIYLFILYIMNERDAFLLSWGNVLFSIIFYPLLTQIEEMFLTLRQNIIE